ncbi:MAG: hypothetical protein NC191_08205 [Muribaculaceae bacterium]|nr:hypothetical protein [Muribaculaceae bacterium]
MITPNSLKKLNHLPSIANQPSFGRRLVPARVSRFYENFGYKTVLSPLMNYKARRFSDMIREHLAPIIKKVTIPLNDGATKAWEICPENCKKYILFLHGIKGTSALPPNQIFIEKIIKNTEYGIITPEYRGSAELNSQKFTFQNIIEDAKATLKYLYNKGIKPEDITVVSHCIGSIPASSIAAEEKGISRFIMLSPVADGGNFGSAILRKLGFKKVPKFLENGFNKLVEIFMPHDMNSVRNIRKATSPITIMHPENDTLITTEQCEKILKETLNPTSTKVIQIPQGIHALGKTNTLAILSQLKS